jgi:hypothetical protein
MRPGCEYYHIRLLQVGVQPERKRADHDGKLRRFAVGAARKDAGGPALPLPEVSSNAVQAQEEVGAALRSQLCGESQGFSSVHEEKLSDISIGRVPGGPARPPASGRRLWRVRAWIS